MLDPLKKRKSSRRSPTTPMTAALKCGADLSLIHLKKVSKIAEVSGAESKIKFARSTKNKLIYDGRSA